MPRQLGEDLGDRVLAEFDTMALRTLEGQATELGWRHDRVTALEPEDYLDLIMHKTCWYTTVHPLRAGALVGGASDLRPFVRFGFHLGAAFQIQDDLLNLLGSEQEYGKEIDGDLYEGKRTLPLIHLIRHARGADRALVDRYLALDRAERDAALVARIRALMDDLREHRVRGRLRARDRERRARRLRGGLRVRATGPRPRVRARPHPVHARAARSDQNERGRPSTCWPT